tara:strand:+ start:516 stop:1097 length:582 start_codon:yes stop_codon:yes gene_type:complete
MQTTKTQEMKANVAARKQELLKREQSNRKSEVEYRNVLNKKANQVEIELRDFFKPFIGKKIRTISGYGSWSKLVSSSLNSYIQDLRDEGFTLRCRYSAGSLMFDLSMYYQAFRTDLFSGLDHTSALTIYIDNIYIGSWDESTGNLYRVAEDIDIDERRTDWTVEELAAIRKKLVETKDELRRLESSISEFSRR